MVGAAALTVPASAAAAEPFSITLFPARLVVPAATTAATFTIVDTGGEPLHVLVRPADAWLVPAESSFDLVAGERHAVSVRIAVPATHDAGDHETSIAFVVPATSGSLRVARGVAANVTIPTGGKGTHRLSFDSLRLPRFVDSTGGPVSVTVRARNEGNVHEDVRLVGTAGGQRLAFQPVAVLPRGSSRALGATWSPPLLCFCQVKVADLSATVVALPLKPIGALVGLLGLAVVISAIRGRRRRPKNPTTGGAER